MWFIFFFTHKDTALYTNLFSIPTRLFGGLRLANNFLHEQTSLLYFADLKNVANDGISTDAYFICLQPLFFRRAPLAFAKVHHHLHYLNLQTYPSAELL